MRYIATTATVLATLVAGAVQAAPYPYYPGAQQMPYQAPPVRAEAEGPGMALRQGMDRLLEFLQVNPNPAKPQLALFLEAEIAPYFDFDYMAKMAAGHLYRDMDPAQRRRLAGTIKVQFLGTMAERLVGYSDQQVKYLSQRVHGDGRTGSATIAVLQPQGYPSRLDFRFYLSDAGWRVYDVLANGQSAVVHFRRQFQKMMYRPVDPGYQRYGTAPPQYYRRSPMSQ